MYRTGAPGRADDGTPTHFCDRVWMKRNQMVAWKQGLECKNEPCDSFSVEKYRVTPESVFAYR